ESGDSVPQTPWDFSLRLAPAIAGPWAGGPPVGDHACRLQGCIGRSRCVPAELYPPLQHRDLGLGWSQCQLLVKTLFHIEMVSGSLARCVGAGCCNKFRCIRTVPDELRP